MRYLGTRAACLCGIRQKFDDSGAMLLLSMSKRVPIYDGYTNSVKLIDVNTTIFFNAYWKSGWAELFTSCSLNCAMIKLENFYAQTA